MSVLRAALQRAGTSGRLLAHLAILLPDRLTSVSWPVQENRVRSMAVRVPTARVILSGD